METTENPQTNGKSAKPIKLPAAKAAKAATKEQTLIINIPPIKTVTTTITVRGISPLIVNAWSEKAKRMMRNKQQGLANEGKEPKDPQADFEGCRYRNSKGQDCVPSIGLKLCGVEAGVIAGAHKTKLRKAFFVGGGEDLVPIDCPEGPVMREDMVRVGMGVADMRYRAQYTEWSIVIPVEFNPRLISAEQLFHLYDNAGYSVGLGEWRPEKDGQFGRFRVVTG